jgi:CheY-like chemotaxis protein
MTDPMVAASTAAIIEDLGHSVVEADSAPRALCFLSTHPNVDLVITDYAMPGMTGTDLAAELKRLRPGLPVVIATGYSDAPEGAGLPRLNKPYRQQDLATLFATLFGPRPDRASESLPALYRNEEAPTPAAI